MLKYFNLTGVMGLLCAGICVADEISYDDGTPHYGYYYSHG